LLVLQWNSFWMRETKTNFESQELQRNAIMMMDSLVKNRDAEKPQYGTALFDAEKRRVQSNQLDRQLLQAIPAAQQDENAAVFFQAIELRLADGTRETIFETQKNGDCLALERFVLMEEKKTVVRGVVCRE